MACVAVPCAAAVVYSFLKGAWPVGVIALLAVAASERRVLRHARFERWLFSGALILGGAVALASGEAVPGAFAVLGFWLAYEAGWWAGADALAAMTLALLWPDIRLLVVLAVTNLGAALVIPIVRLLRRADRVAGAHLWLFSRQQIKSGASQAPGLPSIALAVALLIAWRLVGVTYWG
jgi:hypothetical protein